MNYIKKLQSDCAEQKHKLQCAEHYIEHLISYIDSDKFRGTEGWGGDGYVHVSDIRHRADLVLRSIRWGDPDLEFSEENSQSLT